MSDSTAQQCPVIEARQILLSDGRKFQFSVSRGEAVFVGPSAGELFDVLSGMKTTEGGSASFEGRAWDEADSIVDCRIRARIGRTFPHEKAWVENLSLKRNVELRAAHNLILTASEVHDRIGELADAFGVAAYLEARPERAPDSVLVRCQWIRALLGGPAVLFLEDATAGAREEDIDQLRVYVCRHLDSGGALLWSAPELPGNFAESDGITMLDVTNTMIDP